MIKGAGNYTVGKPIYCHPVTISGLEPNYEYSMKLSFLIFNNDPTPFTQTTFKTFITSLSGATFLCAGGVFYQNRAYMPSYLNNSYNLNCIKITEGHHADISLDEMLTKCTTKSFSDGVNKIN